jgi:hypothetical protein
MHSGTKRSGIDPVAGARFSGEFERIGATAARRCLPFAAQDL